MIPMAWLPLMEGIVRDGREGGLDFNTENGGEWGRPLANAVSHSVRGKGG